MLDKILDAIVNTALSVFCLPAPAVLLSFFGILVAPAMLFFDPENRIIWGIVFGAALICVFAANILDSGSGSKPKNKDWKPIPGARWRKHSHSDPFSWEICPRCHSGNSDPIYELTKRELVTHRRCNYCGKVWEEKRVVRSWPKRKW